MKTEIEQVNGEINKAQGGYHLTWESPNTGEELWCQGEFFYNKKTQNFEHDITDEDGNVLYKVVASI